MDEGHDFSGGQNAQNFDAPNNPLTNPPTNPVESSVPQPSTEPIAPQPLASPLVSQPNTDQTPTGDSPALPNLQTLAESKAFIASHPTQTSASGTGDIILRADPGSSNKKWLFGLIIGVIILACVVLIVLTFTLTSKPNQAQLLESYNAYFNLVKDGPENVEQVSTSFNEAFNQDAFVDDEEEDEEFLIDDETGEEIIEEADPDLNNSEENVTDNETSDTDETEDEANWRNWFLFNMDNYDFDSVARDEYFTNLHDYYDLFADLTAKSQDEGLKNLLKDYPDIINLTLAFVSLDDVVSDLENNFPEKAASVSETIQNLLPANVPTATISASRDQIERYLNLSVDIFKQYQQHGCYDSGELDEYCTLSAVKTDASLSELLRQRSRAYVLINRFRSANDGTFASMSNQIYTALGGNNE